jgi:hypothetical protein
MPQQRQFRNATPFLRNALMASGERGLWEGASFALIIPSAINFLIKLFADINKYILREILPNLAESPFC